MSDAKLENLKALFNNLINWQSQDQLDQLAIISLQIVALLEGNSKTARLIAAHLSLIIIFKDQPSDKPEKLLKVEFEKIDDQLESHLRGFSSLLEQVLLDSTIKLDPDFLLEQLPETYQVLGEPFYKFIRRLDSYYDLSTAFDVYHDRALIVLFIDLLSEIFMIIFNCCKSTSTQQVKDWLFAWLGVNSSYLLVDINISNQESVLAYVSSNIDYTREYLTAYLVVASSEEEPLDNRNLACLDGALQANGFFGLRPLLDAGFLTIAQDSVPKNIAKILRVV